MSSVQTTSRRGFLAASGATALTLKYAQPAAAQGAMDAPYGVWEDLMRDKF